MSLYLIEARRTYDGPDAPRMINAPSQSNTYNSPLVDEAALPDPAPPLRPLTSLKWPYVPEEPAYPDPLKRDDPKSLQLHQYEAIGKLFTPVVPSFPLIVILFFNLEATSPAVRRALASNPQLPALLRSVDALRGFDREEALERMLGVSGGGGQGSTLLGSGQAEEDMHALRELAEAVEGAVRGGKQDVLGLDWGD